MQQRVLARKTSPRVHRDDTWPQFYHDVAAPLRMADEPRVPYALETEIVDCGQRLSRQPPGRRRYQTSSDQMIVLRLDVLLSASRSKILDVLALAPRIPSCRTARGGRL